MAHKVLVDVAILKFALVFSLVHSASPFKTPDRCGSKPMKLEAFRVIKSFSSPNYPNNYPNYQVCQWLISADSEFESIALQIPDSLLRDSASCTKDSVTVYDGKNVHATQLTSWCGLRKPSGRITSTGTNVLVVFVSDGLYSERGFKINYWKIPKDTFVYGKVKYTAINYYLFLGFFCILGTMVCSLVLVLCKRKRKRDQKLREEADQAKKVNIESTA